MKTYEVKDGQHKARFLADTAADAVMQHEPTASVSKCPPSQHRPDSQEAFLVTVKAGKGYNTRSVIVMEVEDE